MPVQSNNFGRFTDTKGAQRAAAQAVGAACLQVAQPAAPVDTGFLRNSHKFVVSGDHVDIGVTADYGLEVHSGIAGGRIGEKNKKKSKKPKNAKRVKLPYPWLRDSINANLNSISDAALKAYEGAL